ncbi:MAG: metal ABC transporter permease [Planctomycetota bacterium]|nr:metal ABC transporter permease [Planctomycetota bacterium]
MILPNTLVVLVGTSTLGICCGLIGSLLLLRKRALLADALAHSTLPGIVLGFLIAGSQSYWALGTGALITTLVGAGLVSRLPVVSRIRPDSATASVLGIFFGAGIALLSLAQRSGPGAFSAGLDHFLLGQAAGMLQQESLILAGAATLMSLIVILLHKEFLTSCFDSAFGSSTGMRMNTIDFIVMILLSLTIVISLPAVGVVLTAALVVIPPATARFWTDRFTIMMAISALIGAASGISGTLLSSLRVDLPTGPVVILCSSVFFFLSMLLAPHRGLVGKRLRWKRRSQRREMLRILVHLFENLKEGNDFVAKERIIAGSMRARPEALRLCQSNGYVLQAGTHLQLTSEGIIRAQRSVEARKKWIRWLDDAAEIDRNLIDLDEEDIEKLLSSRPLLDQPSPDKKPS